MARRRKRRVRAGKVALRFLGRCPAAGAPALECAVAEAGVVVGELRRASSPGLDGMNLVLDVGDDLITMLNMLSRNTADLRWRSRSRTGPKMGVCALGNIC